MRGTIRFKGFCEAMHALLEVGLLDTEPHPAFDNSFGPDMSWVNLKIDLWDKDMLVFEMSLEKFTRHFNEFTSWYIHGQFEK